MSAAFLTAAASYFGLSQTSLRKTEVFTDADTLVLAFEIPLTPDDIKGVARRMEAMAEKDEPEPVDVMEQVDATLKRAEDMQRALREADKALAEQRIGFLQGMLMSRVAPLTAEAMHTDYMRRTVAATERLTGTDGKPTSNAPDFGGLPG